MNFDFREVHIPSLKPTVIEELNKLSFAKLTVSVKPLVLAYFSLIWKWGERYGFFRWLFVCSFIYLFFTCSLQLAGLLFPFYVLVRSS